ncbi:ribonuclease H-like domain-containing protein [Tanacetum coccineum]
MSFLSGFLFLVLFAVLFASVIMAKVLINALDAGNPLFFNSNENSNAYIFSVKLSGSENYKIWATAIRIALKGKNKMVLGMILGSLSPELYLRQVYSEIAAEVWKELEETYDKINRSVIYNVIHKIHILKQGELSDYHKLNDVYQPIRSNLLARDPLPDVEAFNVVSRKESHRGLHPGTRSKAQRGASTSSGSVNLDNAFTKEQMTKVLALINKKPSWSANANMAGGSLHLRLINT